MDHPEFAGMISMPFLWMHTVKCAPSGGLLHPWRLGIHRVSRFLMKQPANCPFEDQIFVGDQTRSNLMRIVLEKVQEARGDLHLLIGPQSGVVRNQFNEQGVLYVVD